MLHNQLDQLLHQTHQDLPWVGVTDTYSSCIGARRAASCSGGQNRTYALGDQQNSEASPDVVTGTLSLFSQIVYSVIDPGSTLLYLEEFIKIAL